MEEKMGPGWMEDNGVDVSSWFDLLNTFWYYISKFKVLDFRYVIYDVWGGICM